MDHVREVAAMHPTNTSKFADNHVPTASPDSVADTEQRVMPHR